jgi:CDP-diacylglycerol--glycerol-3-phosphate 3-phosphatidyltransferase
VRELKRRSRLAADAPARFLGRLGFTPNSLTVLGSVLTASVGILVAQGWFVAAGVCLWLFSVTDTLDGALARATDSVSEFGAFLDSVCDRYAEAAVFFGLVWWYQASGDSLGVVLADLAIMGALLVS